MRHSFSLCLFQPHLRKTGESHKNIAEIKKHSSTIKENDLVIKTIVSYFRPYYNTLENTTHAVMPQVRKASADGLKSIVRLVVTSQSRKIDADGKTLVAKRLTIVCLVSVLTPASLSMLGQ